jgi:hypothetical protein
MIFFGGRAHHFRYLTHFFFKFINPSPISSGISALNSHQIPSTLLPFYLYLPKHYETQNQKNKLTSLSLPLPGIWAADRYTEMEAAFEG